MSKGERTIEEYEREIADIMDRFLEHGREFAALENEEQWYEFVQSKIMGYHGFDLTAGQEAFYEDARLRIRDAISEGDIGFQTYESRAGEQRAIFRGEKGRFLSFQNVKSFVRGLLNPFGR